MENTETEFQLNIGIPNGIILGAIGILELLTPLFVEFTPEEAVVNITAGIILVGGGMVSLFVGIRQSGKISNTKNHKKSR